MTEIEALQQIAEALDGIWFALGGVIVALGVLAGIVSLRR